MPVFRDAEDPFVLRPEGDYILTVESFSQAISSGAKTAGCAQYNLKIGIEGGGKINEVLLDSEQISWKIDNFLKAAGIKLAVNEAFEFMKSLAEERGVKWINPCGLRFWAHVVVQEYTKQNGTKGRSNKIGAYILNKGKLEPVAMPEPEDAPF